MVLAIIILLSFIGAADVLKQFSKNRQLNVDTNIKIRESLRHLSLVLCNIVNLFQARKFYITRNKYKVYYLERGHIVTAHLFP